MFDYIFLGILLVLLTVMILYTVYDYHKNLKGK